MNSKIFNQSVIPSMTYAWTTTKIMRNKLRTTQRVMERVMLGITRKDKINIIIKERMKVKDLIGKIRNEKGRVTSLG